MVWDRCRSSEQMNRQKSQKRRKALPHRLWSGHLFIISMMNWSEASIPPLSIVEAIDTSRPANSGKNLLNWQEQQPS